MYIIRCVLMLYHSISRVYLIEYIGPSPSTTMRDYILHYENLEERYMLKHSNVSKFLKSRIHYRQELLC